MSRKIFEEAIKKKVDRGMKSWPSMEMTFRGPWELLSKRLTKGMIKMPSPEQAHPRDPVFDATARAFEESRKPR